MEEKNEEIILNGSPRKNWNTAQLLKEAQKGAESVGTEVEYDEFDNVEELIGFIRSGKRIKDKIGQ